MGNRKASQWRRALTGGLAAALLAGLPVVQSQAAEPVDVMVIAAHPDDDILLAGGIVKSALDSGQSVKIAFATNGDECLTGDVCDDPVIGTTRQNEGVAAQGLLGSSESNLIFFGYPSTYLDCIRYGADIDPTRCAEMANLPSAVTYASRGLGSTDWHNYWAGSHAAFTWANFDADMVELLDTYRPADIYTHALWDIHSDHRITYNAVIEAVDAIPGYDPVVHIGLVHVDDPAYPFAWPDYSGASPALPHTTPNYSASLWGINATNPWDLLESDTSSELKWEQREVVAVPSEMLNTTAGSNLKYLALAAHSSQFYDTFGLIQRFIHSDEVFWTYVVGSAAGIDDSYSLDEAGTLNVGGSGVLVNDIRGAGTPPGAPFDPTPLGPLQANQISSPSHGSLTLQSDGSFTYVHDGSENFTDSFTYQPRQGSTYGNYTTVAININPIDEAPTADDDGPYNLANGESVNVAAPGVLAGDSDPDGDSLTAQLVTDVAHGTLSLNSNGSFTYTHDGTDTLTDSFTYVAKDPGGNTSNTATVSLTIDPAGYIPPLVVTVSGPSTAAQGLAQSFTSSVSGGEGTRSYAWAVSRNGAVVKTSTAAALSFTPGTPGDYAVALVVSDDTGSANASTTLKVLGDISDSPFMGDIIWLADAGITKGCNPPTNDQFCPNANVTRGQMAAFLVRFLGLTDAGGGDLFVDDDASIFEADIDKLATAGVTAGCNPPANDRFCPNDYVTRGQMAAFLVRALALTDNGGGNLFTDDDGSVFEANIDKMATAGITRGCNPPANTLFCPNGLVTRGQMAAFLHRANGLTGS